MLPEIDHVHVLEMVGWLFLMPFLIAYYLLEVMGFIVREQSEQWGHLVNKNNSCNLFKPLSALAFLGKVFTIIGGNIW